MNIFKKIINKWFDLEPDICPNCELLKQILEQERFERKEMLNVIIESNKPKTEYVPVQTPQEFKPKVVSWRVRQAALEQEDRIKAALLKNKTKEMKDAQVDVSDLEQEMGIIEKERENGS